MPMNLIAKKNRLALIVALVLDFSDAIYAFENLIPGNGITHICCHWTSRFVHWRF